MSRYGEKHPHVAECGVGGCPLPGTKLATVSGKIGWLCEHHKESLDRKSVHDGTSE